MTLYLDTSDLIKLYVDEPGSAELQARVEAADAVATSVVAYAETRAAIARLRRERRLAPSAVRSVLDQLDADWPHFVIVPVGDDLAAAAGRLADSHGLRGFDAIHLASFEQLLARSGDDALEFSAADDRLRRAARRLG